MPVIVNVAGESIEDYVEVCKRLDGQPGVAGIELNISCPNVGAGGLQFALDPGAAGDLTAAVREATDLPLMVKLSPAATDIRTIAKRIAEGGADAISACNTLPGMAIDRMRRKALLGNVYGGLSGPALKPVALRVVYEVAQVVKIPIVAIGGIGSLDDVLDFLFAGAAAVQVGTRCSPIRCCPCGWWTSLPIGAPRTGMPRTSKSWVRRCRKSDISRASRSPNTAHEPKSLLAARHMPLRGGSRRVRINRAKSQALTVAHCAAARRHDESHPRPSDI